MSEIDRSGAAMDTTLDPHRCARCEGDGSYSTLADCTTFGPDCACNGPRVIVDPCDVCGGSGIAQ